MRNFQTYELVDPDTYYRMGDDALTLFNPLALQMLDDFREFMNVPVTINTWYHGGKFKWRGWRTPEQCRILRSPNSQHGKGNAFDLDVDGMAASFVRDMILRNKNNPLLHNIMRMEDLVNWVHIDCKPVSERIYLFRA